MSRRYGVFCGQMSSQVVYQTNADWHDSYDAMAKNTLVTVEETKKGLLWFHFKDSRTVFILSPTGKLQVKWSDLPEKRILYKQIKNLLIAKPNEKLTIKPLKQQMWIEYPVPESFKIYWCDHWSEFALKKSFEKIDAERTVHPEITDIFKRKSLHKIEEENRIAEFKEHVSKIKKAIEELRHEFRHFREPTLNEIALKSGCLDVRSLRIFLSPMDWIGESQEEAKRVTEQAINLAGWLRFKEKGELKPRLIALSNEALESTSMKAIEKAQVILKNYPNLVPNVEADEVKWPDETKLKWIQVFGCEPPASPGYS